MSEVSTCSASGRARWPKSSPTSKVEGAVVVARRIVGFHTDVEDHWVADLECGHTQHVRHDPPWQIRPWVLTAEGRDRFLGTPLNCVLCDAEKRADQLIRPM